VARRSGEAALRALARALEETSERDQTRVTESLPLAAEELGEKR
jgi:hypothetical protein